MGGGFFPMKQITHKTIFKNLCKASWLSCLGSEVFEGPKLFKNTPILGILTAEREFPFYVF